MNACKAKYWNMDGAKSNEQIKAVFLTRVVKDIMLFMEKRTHAYWRI